jgi:hypothetical protein
VTSKLIQKNVSKKQANNSYAILPQLLHHSIQNNELEAIVRPPANMATFPTEADAKKQRATLS